MALANLAASVRAGRRTSGAAKPQPCQRTPQEPRRHPEAGRDPRPPDPPKKRAKEEDPRTEQIERKREREREERERRIKERREDIYREIDR